MLFAVAFAIEMQSTTAGAQCPSDFSALGTTHQSTPRPQLISLIAIETQQAKLFARQTPEAQRYIVRALVNEAKIRLGPEGYEFKTVTIDGFERLEITKMSGRTAAFLRRYQRRMGDKMAKIAYDPRRILAEGGPSGAEYFPSEHTIFVDSVTLQMSQQGTLAYIKHELRHSRFAQALAAGRIDGFQGDLYFGGPDGIPKLGAYQYHGSVEEVQTWDRQQLDLMKELRRWKNQIAGQRSSFFRAENGVQVASYLSTLETLRSSSEIPLEFRRQLIKEDAKIRSGLASGIVQVGSSSEGKPVFLFGRPYKDLQIIVHSIEERSAFGLVHRLVVSTPSFDSAGRRLIENDGSLASNHFSIPIPKGLLRQALSDPEAARLYILRHLDRMNSATEASAEAVARRLPEAEALINELRTLEQRYR